MLQHGVFRVLLIAAALHDNRVCEAVQVHLSVVCVSPPAF
jgi:hypothetical protein